MGEVVRPDAAKKATPYSLNKISARGGACRSDGPGACRSDGNDRGATDRPDDARNQVIARRRAHVTATANMTTPPAANAAPASARRDTRCPK